MYFKIWSSSLLNPNNKAALKEEDFVDDYSFACFCCFDFFGRPIDNFYKEINGRANPKVEENVEG
ncbi:hypothetical protein KEJ26_03105 [Candidatus Bathyarchaeota archaeon]|nr:hypothetical protein [Candidatus Bathyarchaeota archaeon]